jgi:hypothetical protein
MRRVAKRTANTQEEKACPQIESAFAKDQRLVFSPKGISVRMGKDPNQPWQCVLQLAYRRAANLPKAIEAYPAALQVCTEEDFRPIGQEPNRPRPLAVETPSALPTP